MLSDAGLLTLSTNAMAENVETDCQGAWFDPKG